MKKFALIGALVSAVFVVGSVVMLVLLIDSSSAPIWVFNIFIWGFNTFMFTRTYLLESRH